MVYELVMNKLVKMVTRKFYEPYHVVIMDILLSKVLLYDIDLCERMKMLSKEVNKLVMKLKEDRMIKYETKVENKEDNKQILRVVYYINYAEVRDVIKYKVFKMMKNLESDIKAAQVEGYVCVGCGLEYSSLDAQFLMENYVFKCADCREDLIENKKDKSSDCIVHSNMMLELHEIIELLKDTDKFDIPSLDYFQVLEIKRERERCFVQNKECDENITSHTVLTEEFNLEESCISAGGETQTSVPVFSVDEFVTVGGVKKPFSSVTEEDKEMMNEEEYEKYYEIYEKYYGCSSC